MSELKQKFRTHPNKQFIPIVHRKSCIELNVVGWPHHCHQAAFDQQMHKRWRIRRGSSSLLAHNLQRSGIHPAICDNLTFETGTHLPFDGIWSYTHHNSRKSYHSHSHCLDSTHQKRHKHSRPPFEGSRKCHFAAFGLKFFRASFQTERELCF